MRPPGRHSSQSPLGYRSMPSLRGLAWGATRWCDLANDLDESDAAWLGNGSDGTRTRDLRRDRPIRAQRRLTTNPTGLASFARLFCASVRVTPHGCVDPETAFGPRVDHKTLSSWTTRRPGGRGSRSKGRAATSVRARPLFYVTGGVVVRRPRRTAAPAPTASSKARRMPTATSTCRELDGFAAVASAGNLIVAMASRWINPLVRLRCARQGPSGRWRPSRTSAGSEAPGARSGRSVTGNGPARRPPGPCVSVSCPPMSSARPPLSLTRATTSSPPDAERSAWSWPMAKSAAARPPEPIERYMQHRRGSRGHAAAGPRRARYLGPDDGISLACRSLFRHLDRHGLAATAPGSRRSICRSTDVQLLSRSARGCGRS